MIPVFMPRAIRVPLAGLRVLLRDFRCHLWPSKFLNLHFRADSTRTRFRQFSTAELGHALAKALA